MWGDDLSHRIEYKQQSIFIGAINEWFFRFILTDLDSRTQNIGKLNQFFPKIWRN